jgi:hypothetical protein
MGKLYPGIEIAKLEDVPPPPHYMESYFLAYCGFIHMSPLCLRVCKTTNNLLYLRFIEMGRWGIEFCGGFLYLRWHARTSLLQRNPGSRSLRSLPGMTDGGEGIAAMTVMTAGTNLEWRVTAERGCFTSYPVLAPVGASAINGVRRRGVNVSCAFFACVPRKG